jgi:hypothetical protein
MYGPCSRTASGIAVEFEHDLRRALLRRWVDRPGLALPYLISQR